MNPTPKLLSEIAAQEQRLVFDRFSNEDAWDLGTLMVTLARERRHRIALRIERGGQILFQYALEGTTPDNDGWIARKNRTVYRFGRSSLAVGVGLALAGDTLDGKYGLDRKEYAPDGGAFPIAVRGAGLIGVVTVTGLSQEEDHAFVVECLERYLSRGE